MSPLGWFGIARLGLVQAALGAMVVLATSTLNRVMVVEWSLPALVPGVLVALHYGVQVLRPRMGHGSDVGRRRTPWIVGGMAALAGGSVAAAMATAWMGTHPVLGIAAALAAYALIGMGVGAAGTSLLVLLAKRVTPERRAAAASTVWIMMIAGIAITAIVAGALLDPFSPARLVAVVSGAATVALGVSLLAVWGMEGTAPAADRPAPEAVRFRDALAQVWAEPKARRFAVFVFLSMLAYSAQELVIEPFAGAVFHLTPGESTGLAGLQHAGVLAGMLLVAVAGSLGRRAGMMRAWTVGGCIASALAILALALCGLSGLGWTLRPVILVLGVANGTFAVSAIGAMMALANSGRASREGVRMGVWGAAQALAFALGGLAGTLASDIARAALDAPATAYAAVFLGEMALFLIAAHNARRVFGPAAVPARPIGFVPLQAGE